MPQQAHALDRVKIAPVHDPKSLLALWKKPQSYGMRKALLRLMLSPQPHPVHAQEVIGFFLVIADQFDTIYVGGDNSEKGKLSVYAFKLLCRRIFRDPKYPVEVFYSDPLFSKLLQFFGRREAGVNTSNLHPQATERLGKNHGKRVLANIRNFAEDFARKAWDFETAMQLWSDDRKLRKALHSLTQKHWEEVLDLMDRLDLLDHLIYHPPTLERFEKMRKKVLTTPFKLDAGQAEAEGKSENYTRNLAEAYRFSSQLPFSPKLIQTLLVIEAKLGLS